MFDFACEQARKDPDGFGGIELVHANTVEKVLSYSPGHFFMQGQGYTQEVYQAALSRHWPFSER